MYKLRGNQTRKNSGAKLQTNLKIEDYKQWEILIY